MSLTRRVLPRIVATAVVAAVAACACGPFFGIEVLRHREQVLLAPPTISFEKQLRALVPPPSDKLPVLESASGSQDQDNRATLEARQLSPAFLARVTEMWAQNSGDVAYTRGGALPPAIRLYTAGAVSLLHGQTEHARTYIQSILSLPPQQRRSRELWTRFTLGRVAFQQEKYKEAASQFEVVRILVKQGVPDDLGLAVASLGEQARCSWRQGEGAQAVQLYAQQASYGSQSAANSLVMIAGLILKDANLLDRAVQDPTTLRLLFICLNGNSGRPFFVEPAHDRDLDSKVNRLLAALEKRKVTPVEGAGLLASAVYSQGRFDLAQRLAALEDVPISAWVRAKLALRRGDRKTALTEYQKALIAPKPSIDDPTRVTAELAVLRVSRGDYLQALDLFYHAAAQGWTGESQWDGYTGRARSDLERTANVYRAQPSSAFPDHLC